MTLNTSKSSFFVFYFLLVAGFFLTGCQTQVATTQPEHRQSNDFHVIEPGLANPSFAKTALIQQYKEWQGVPYRAGGESRHGVDCSGFMQLTFREQFDIDLPRDTSNQVLLGKAVAKRKLRPGDLVFFQIGRRTRHVGVVIENNKFLHASSSQGVMISDLDDAYWSRHYWQARRITTDPVIVREQKYFSSRNY
jgi:cell wall-associated NlpC family hydrolase